MRESGERRRRSAWGGARRAGRGTLSLVGMAAVALALTACDDPYCYPQARVEAGGSSVMLTLSPSGEEEVPITVRALGQSVTWTPSSDAGGEGTERFLYFAAESFGPGDHDIKVVTEVGGRRYEESAEVSVPEGPYPLFFRIHGCTDGPELEQGLGLGRDYRGVRAVALSSELGDAACVLDAQLRAPLRATASPGTTVTLGDQTLRPDAHGAIRHMWPLGATLATLSLNDDEPHTFEIPLRVERGGQPPLSGTIRLTARRDLTVQALVEAARSRTAASLGGRPSAGAAPFLYQIGDRDPRVVGEGTFGQLRVIGLGEPAAPRSAGRCGPYRSLSQAAAPERLEVDARMIAVEIRTGRTLGERLISAARSACPTAVGADTVSVTLLPSDEAIGEWIGGL